MQEDRTHHRSILNQAKALPALSKQLTLMLNQHLGEFNQLAVINQIAFIYHAFLGFLQGYYTPHLSNETKRTVDFAIFVEANVDSLTHIHRSNLSPSRKKSVIELYRAYFFLRNATFNPASKKINSSLHQLLMKLYSLKSHLYSVHLEQDACSLFDAFFQLILPLFTEEMIRDFAALDVGSHYHSECYDHYVQKKTFNILVKEIKLYREKRVNYQNKERPEEILNKILASNLNSLSQYLALEYAWNALQNLARSNNQFIVSLFALLARHANNNCIAAAHWIVSAAKHKINLFEQDQIAPCYAQFSFKELMQLIHQSIQLSTSSNRYLILFFKKLIESKINHLNPSEFEFTIQMLKRNGERMNISLFLLQKNFILTVVNHRPDFIHLLDALQIEFIRNFERMACHSQANPLSIPNLDDKNKYFFKLLKHHIEIRKNARILAQGMRTHSLFEPLPQELVLRIAAETQHKHMLSQTHLQNIASLYFSHPLGACTAEIRKNARILAQGYRTHFLFKQLPKEWWIQAASSTRLSTLLSQEEAFEISTHYFNRPTTANF